MPYIDGIYKPGDRKYNCDICGFTYRFLDMKKGISREQKGFDVCPDCFDPRHPLTDWKFKSRREKIKKVGE